MIQDFWDMISENNLMNQMNIHNFTFFWIGALLIERPADIEEGEVFLSKSTLLPLRVFII